MTTLKIVAGSAGVGKSTRLINDGLEASLQMKSVFIMVPTHTAKDNLVKAIDDMLKVEYQDMFASQAKIKALEKMRYNVHVLYGYSGEEVVLIDEMSMINVPTLKALFWDTYFLPHVAITGYGDAKQLESIAGNSMIEELLRLNVEGDVWQWVQEAYENVAFNTMVAPNNWRLEGPVEFETMLTNYRLNNLGFDGYNDEYIDALFNYAIDYSGEIDKDYSEAILSAVENYSLIIAPTHDRGSEVNDYIMRAYPKTYIEVMPFVKETNGTKVYLNPANPNQDELHEKFPFMKSIPGNVDMKNLTPTAYIVVNVAQGATVDNAVYYFGDSKIPAGKVQHFYSYNRIFTAITRSRNLTQLIGNTAEMRKQFDIHPMSAKQRLQYRTADVAVTELFERLYAMKEELSLDEIHEMFMKIFEVVKPDDKVAKELEDYNVKSIPYTKEQLVLRFKSYDSTKALRYGFHPDYKQKIYDKHIAEVRGKSAKGKGAVQTWINSLTPAQLEEVKKDLESLSVRKFAEKYDKRQKKNVKKALDL